nr:hypothetical protein [Angustibacter aerolatus]
MTALDRDVLTDYGRYQVVDGKQVPRWLIADGGDASAEALLGLSAYVRAGGSARARTAMDRLAEGVAALQGGDATHWPFGAVLPWGLSRADWHAWGAQMPAGLSAAAGATRVGDVRRSATRAAVSDTAGFTPWLLTTEGPDNGLLPTPVERAQIAYGADARVQSLLAAARLTGRTGLRDEAGLAAGWFFGANRSGARTYDPATGVTFDGVEADGRVNRNSGAESTIHGLLTMLALDADPRARALARTGTTYQRTGSSVVQAEDGATSGGAAAVTPASLWTGESSFGGTGYVDVPDGGSVSFAVPAADRGQRLVLPVVEPARRLERGHHVPRRRPGARHRALRCGRPRRCVRRARRAAADDAVEAAARRGDHGHGDHPVERRRRRPPRRALGAALGVGARAVRRRRRRRAGPQRPRPPHHPAGDAARQRGGARHPAGRPRPHPAARGAARRSRWRRHGARAARRLHDRPPLRPPRVVSRAT